MNTIDNLPKHILTYIFRNFLPFSDVLNCTTVSKRWKTCADSSGTLFKNISLRNIEKFETYIQSYTDKIFPIGLTLKEKDNINNLKLSEDLKKKIKIVSITSKTIRHEKEWDSIIPLSKYLKIIQAPVETTSMLDYLLQKPNLQTSFLIKIASNSFKEIDHWTNHLQNTKKSQPYTKSNFISGTLVLTSPPN